SRPLLTIGASLSWRPVAWLHSAGHVASPPQPLVAKACREPSAEAVYTTPLATAGCCETELPVAADQAGVQGAAPHPPAARATRAPEGVATYSVSPASATDPVTAEPTAALQRTAPVAESTAYTVPASVPA